MTNTSTQALENSKQTFNWGTLNPAKLKVIKAYAGKKILDVGCSKGTYVNYLNNLDYDAYGCDILADDRWNDSPTPEKFKTCDIYNLPYKDKSFETVVLFEVLEHLSDQDKALTELSRVASKNIIISIPNNQESKVFFFSGLTYYHNLDRTHINFFSEKTIRQLLKKHKLVLKSFQLVDPLKPETFLLYSWGFPLIIARAFGELMKNFPLKRKFYTDMILVASKNK